MGDYQGTRDWSKVFNSTMKKMPSKKRIKELMKFAEKLLKFITK